MVDSIVTFIVKSTVGKLAGWGRDKATERLSHGAAFHQKICRLIESDGNIVKRELRALKRKDLRECIKLFNEGRSISQVDVSEVYDPRDESDGPPNKKQKIDNAAIDEAKGRFKEARQKATSALANSALKAEDSILATEIKIKAQLLESEYSTSAFTFCMQDLKDIHSRKDIAANFQTEINYLHKWSPKKSAKGRAIVWDVCNLNRILFDMVQEVEEETVFHNLFIWPCIEIKSAKERVEIDPLRDPRLDEIFLKENRNFCSVVLSFGQKGEKEQHKLKFPRRIVTNAQGQFLVVDGMETKVFDNSGKYLKSLPLSTDINTQYHAVDVDTDQFGNVYLLVSMTDGQNDEVHVFDKDGEAKPHYKFQLAGPKYKECKLAAVNLTEVLVLKRKSEHPNAKIEIYQTKTEMFQFAGHFGESNLIDAQDIVCGTKDRIFVLDNGHPASKTKYIHEFSKTSHRHLQKFEVASDSAAIAFHRASEHLVIASTNKENLLLSLCTTDGKPKRTYKLKETGIVSNITVTAKGRIVVALTQQLEDEYQGKVIVL